MVVEYTHVLHRVVYRIHILISRYLDMYVINGVIEYDFWYHRSRMYVHDFAAVECRQEVALW